MADTTATYLLPYPEATDAPEVWTDMQNLAEAVDTSLGDVDARGAWASYSPAWTSTGTAPALGNGTLTGSYKQVGDTVHVRAVLTLGSTSTVGTGAYRLSLPVGGVVGSLLSALFKDSSASARYSGTVELASTGATGDNMRINVDSSTGVVGATIPVVPANGDSLTISGTYEAA